jgi:CBS domain-containing protein
MPLSEVAKNPPLFLPGDSAMAALTELKKNGLSFAPVMDNDIPSGLLISDEVMMKLI